MLFNWNLKSYVQPSKVYTYCPPLSDNMIAHNALNVWVFIPFHHNEKFRHRSNTTRAIPNFLTSDPDETVFPRVNAANLSHLPGAPLLVFPRCFPRWRGQCHFFAGFLKTASISDAMLICGCTPSICARTRSQSSFAQISPVFFTRDVRAGQVSSPH